MISEPTLLQKSTMFLGNLCALERAQEAGVTLVRSITFNKSSVWLDGLDGEILVPIESKAEDLRRAFRPRVLLPPIWPSRGIDDYSDWGRWIQMHFHLGATSNEMEFIVSGMRFVRIALDGRYSEIRMTDGRQVGIARVPLDPASENAALAIELAEAFSNRSAELTFIQV